MEKKKLTFEAVAKSATLNRGGITPWIDRLSKEDRECLEEIRSRWIAGGRYPGSTTFARSIIEHCKAAGIQTVGISQVSRWLNQS